MSRREDFRLVTGSGCYTADWNLEGQLHAVFLRADRAHARIARLDVSRARSHPGVHGIYTGDDVAAAGFKSLPNNVSYPGVDGQTLRKPHFPVLAQGKVRYVGETIALIVADSISAAEDARELIDIEYEDLPAVVGFEAALAGDAAQLHDDVPGNLAFEFESGDAAAVAEAFKRARYVSRVTVNSQRLSGNPMEPRACLVAYDGNDDAYTIHLPLQGAGGMRAQLATVSGVPKEKIRLVAQDVGGSFGVRGAAYPEYFALMIAARALRRPVKWTGTRAESFATDFHGRALSLTGELALDADGRFLAIRWDDRADLGAYAGIFGAFIATKNLTVTIGGVYRIPAMYARIRLAYTNAAPVSAYRGAGRPDIAYAVERLVDYAAREHGFDPVALRRLNFVPPEAMPYKTTNAGTYDSGDFAAVMDDALSRAGWFAFDERRKEAARRGKLRGIGLATYLEAGGGGSAPKDQVAVRFDSKGDMTLYAVTHSSGQGHETVFPQIVAEALGIPQQHVRFHPGPSSPAELVGSGTGGSRGALGTGSAFSVLAQQLIDAGKVHAAQGLQAGAEEVRYADGRYTFGDRSIGFLELAQSLAQAGPHPLDMVAEGSFGATYPNGCHIAEVEIDPDTGACDIVRYTAVDDLGNVINPQLVEGQVHGGVLQGAGQAFGEHAVYDAGGQLLTGSFADYVMPRAGWLRDMIVHDHPVPTPMNALGAKGVGESGCSGSLPAFANAVVDALHVRGIRHLDMPYTPARVWSALQQATATDC